LNTFAVDAEMIRHGLCWKPEFGFLGNMKRLVFLLLVLATASAQKISVRIVDDVTGKALPDRTLGMSISESATIKSNNPIHLMAQSGDSEIAVFSLPEDSLGRFVEVWDSTEGGTAVWPCRPNYPPVAVDLVADQGFVVPYEQGEHCKRQKQMSQVKASPGEIVIFVHRFSWWDRFIREALGPFAR
jgi:hypothetical protein